MATHGTLFFCPISPTPRARLPKQGAHQYQQSNHPICTRQVAGQNLRAAPGDCQTNTTGGLLQKFCFDHLVMVVFWVFCPSTAFSLGFFALQRYPWVFCPSTAFTLGFFALQRHFPLLRLCSVSDALKLTSQHRQSVHAHAEWEFYEAATKSSFVLNRNLATLTENHLHHVNKCGKNKPLF